MVSGSETHLIREYISDAEKMGIDGSAPEKASLAHIQQQLELLQLHIELVDSQLAVTRSHSEALARTVEAHCERANIARIEAMRDASIEEGIRRRRPIRDE